MILPRRLFQTADREFCEEDDVRQAFAYGSPGMMVQDAEAERIGLKAYLDRTGHGPVATKPVEAKEMPAKVEEKAVAQSEVEDKSIDWPVTHKADTSEEEESHVPGLHVEPESRRVGGRRSSSA